MSVRLNENPWSSRNSAPSLSSILKLTFSCHCPLFSMNSYCAYDCLHSIINASIPNNIRYMRFIKNSSAKKSVKDNDFYLNRRIFLKKSL